MSDRGGPDDRTEGGRPVAGESDPLSPTGGYDFGYGGWTVTVGSLPLAHEQFVDEPLPAVSARENSLKNRLRSRRAADRVARENPPLSFGARPAPAPGRIADDDDGPLAPDDDPRDDDRGYGDERRDRDQVRHDAGRRDPERRHAADRGDPRRDNERRFTDDRRDHAHRDDERRPTSRRDDDGDGRALEAAPRELMPLRPAERQRRQAVVDEEPRRRREPSRPVRRDDDDEAPERLAAAAERAARVPLGDGRVDASRQRARPPEEPRRARRAAAAPADSPPPPPSREDESSRRSARISGGGTGSVVIEDRLFELVDWSSGGIAIRSDNQYYRVGDVRPLEVEIDLGDYAVNLDLDGEVVNRTSERTGWRFRNPSETQRQVLRALTHAAAHGRAFVSPRPLPARADEAPRPAAPARTRRRISPLGALMSLPFNAAVVGLIAMAGIMAIEGRPQPVAPAADAEVQALLAAVAVDRVSLTAGVPGRLVGWTKQPGDPVAPGEPVVAIAGDTEGAVPTPVLSPCDCILARVLIPEGRASVGEAIAALYPRTAEAYVQAVFAADEAPRVGEVAAVALAYDRTAFEGTVVRVGRTPQSGSAIGLSEEQLNTAGTVYARIRTTPAVPAALAGDPAVVTLRPGAPSVEIAPVQDVAPGPAPAADPPPAPATIPAATPAASPAPALPGVAPAGAPPSFATTTEPPAATAAPVPAGAPDVAPPVSPADGGTPVAAEPVPPAPEAVATPDAAPAPADAEAEQAAPAPAATQNRS